MNSAHRSIVLSLVTLVLAACGGGNANQTAPETPTSGTMPASTASADIIATAESAGQFKTLLAAVKAADLESTLKGPGPFTVFAPTDDAFAKLPAGTVEGLLKPENKEKLKAILTYHVVSGNVPSSAAVKLSSAKTVNGKELRLSTANGGLEINGAKVLKADVAASNGVIHVIDKVVIPE